MMRKPDVAPAATLTDGVPLETWSVRTDERRSRINSITSIIIYSKSDVSNGVIAIQRNRPATAWVDGSNCVVNAIRRAGRDPKAGGIPASIAALPHIGLCVCHRPGQ